jgi:DNA-binding transcriptional MocR family regulator
LEAEGYLQARPQSGFFVLTGDADAIPEPDSARFQLLPVEVSLSEQVLSYMEPHARSDLVRFGIALPAPEIMPVKKIFQTLSEVARRQPLDAWDYLHPNGTGVLLHHLARRSLPYEIALTADDIIVTSGCMEALTLALRCVSRPGDAIAVESPTYYGTLLLLEAHERRAIEIPTRAREGMCLDTLEKVFAEDRVAACMFSANAQNPLGFTMSLERKRALVALSEKYQIPLIENDIWGDTVYEPEQAMPAKAFDRQGLVIYCNSFSKSLIPGFRIGWAAPGRFHRRFRELKQLSTITSASAPQIVLGRLLESGFYAQHLRELRTRLQAQVEETGREVRKSFPVGTRVSSPPGGCVLWIRLPRTIDSNHLFEEAMKLGIHVFPGLVFSAEGAHHNYLRLNAGNPLTPAIRAAIRDIGKLISGMVAAAEHAAAYENA